MATAKKGPVGDTRRNVSRRSIGDSESAADELLARMRRLALQEQRDMPRRFLSLRAAANRFGVKTSEVAAVYRELGREGILAGIRGSGTLIRAKGASRTLKVKGVVGMPVSIWRFLAFREYREGFLQIHDALFARGFVTRCIFYDGWDADADFLIRSFGSGCVDYVLWLLADGFGRDTALRLRDRGIQFIGVSFASVPGVFCNYEVRRRRAISAVFSHWRSEGVVRRAAILRIRGETSGDTKRMRRVLMLAEAQEIDCKFETLPEHHAMDFIRTCCSERGTALILPGPAASTLAWREPETLVDLLADRRAAFIDGVFDMRISQQRSATPSADLVSVHWPPIAARIAADAATGAARAEDEPIIFEAEHQLRVPLHELAVTRQTR
jgi:hypothetical protein